LKKVATSFGLTVPPKVDLNVAHNDHSTRYAGSFTSSNNSNSSNSGFPASRKKMKGQSGRFSAENPYGQRAHDGKRQFQR